ncbi:MAG: quinone-dependent dihydroorotate dehydrogenase [Bauldia sp.]
MSGLLDRLGVTLLFRFDPETAHRMAIRALALDVHGRAAPPDPILSTSVLGLDFPSPIGLAAGFDKNAEAVGGLLKLGFGFVEVGTVTPLAQLGNPKPRMFRLERDRAIVNRLGFNNDGAETVARRLGRRAGDAGIVGVNIGANRDSADRIADYVAGVDRFARIASYLALNVSSPNTAGLRGLQKPDALAELLGRAVAARDEATNGLPRPTPLLLKIAPDLDERALEDIVLTVQASGIDGMIVSNTTVSRAGLAADRHSTESGGLSGPPLFRRSTIVLAKVRRLAGPGLPLIGVGGVETAADALAKVAAGANLVQVYTGMIYRGQGIAAAIARDLAARLRAAGFRSIGDAVGTDNARWSAPDLPPG